MLLKAIPNILTTLRILLVPFFIMLFYSNLFYMKILSLCIFFLSSITDFLDGYIARKYNLTTTFGKFVDPLADKILVLSAFFILHNLYPNYIPLWMVFSIFIRDVIITVFRIYLNYKNSVLKTSILAKRKTLFQIIVIHILLIFHIFYPSDSTLYTATVIGQIFFILMFLCVIFTIMTGVHYFIINSSKNG